MSPRLRFNRDGIEVWHGDAREVAAMQEAGSFACAILDGPYGMRKAAWDMMKIPDLPEWYAPHLDAVGRLCGASASLYVWNTAEGWATLHPAIVARGWTFRSLIVWDKAAPASAFGAAAMTTWQDATEVCGHYTRGVPHFNAESGGVNVWRFSSKALALRRMRTGRQVPRKGGGMNAESLHPCQKPTAFAERMIRASTRPGEAVWAPFGGTCREAVAAQRIARQDPAEARRVVTAELDQDGRSYLDAVCRVLNGAGSAQTDPRQAVLW